jgi:transposase
MTKLLKKKLSNCVRRKQTYQNSPETTPQLYKWSKEFEEFGKISFPGKGNLKLTPEQEKIHELEKRLKDAELERDILKKAIGIFSKSGR